MTKWNGFVATGPGVAVEEAWKPRLALGAIVAVPGLFNLLSYLGIIPWYRSPGLRCRAIFCDPFHWQVGAFGLAFLCAGLAFIIPPRYARLGTLNGVTLLVALVSAVAGSFWAR